MQAAFQSGFASALLDVLFNKVTNVVIVEIKKVLQSDVALDKLETTILQAQILLKQVDTSELQGTIKNILQDRIDKLISLYYDADDLMVDIVSLIKSKPERNSVRRSILASPRSWTKPRDIRKLQAKLDTIMEELKLVVELTSHYESNIRDPKLNDCHKPNLDMPFFGREGDVEAITEDLISCTSRYQGVSIVGMDGLGKTMLALKIRNEARIIAHFSVSLWVDVTDGCFNLEETIKQLDQTLAKKVSHSTSSLLITFDNLLEVKLGDWSRMFSHIASKGTCENRYTTVRFLITTFSPKVVTNTRTSSYYLGPLCDEDCKKVIVATAESLNPNMSEMYFPNDVTLTLAKNSGGLPSVASLLGAFLAQYDLEKVRSILCEGLWDSTEFQTEILPVFKPCYSKIQSHLNRCLGYFSIFPNNYPLVADDLVHLWVGEGFIQDTKSAPKLTEIGKEHFNELLGMSILRRVDKMPQSGIPTYELSHFGHKFAKLAASKTCLHLFQGVSLSNLKTRHLSLFYNINSWPQWDDLKKLKALRTFFALFKSNIGKIPPSAFKKLTRLRVLSLSGTDVHNIPDSIHCLKRLCYLDISHTPIKSLPKTLCELRDLQFLKLIKDEGTLESFPINFQKLTNMIHIDWDVRDIRHMGLPSHIGKLSSLQTLPLFPVGDKVGHLISELQDMEHLQGSILITNLENVKDWAMAKVAKLHTKSFRRVELEWKKSNNNVTEKRVLSCLEPCPNLKELKITNYHGDAFPKWLTNSLQELEEMHLQNCPNVQGLPMHDLLTSLKILILEKMRNVIKVDHHFFGKGHFKKLDSLELKHMEQLHSWIVESESNVMPRLHALKFIDCPNLINMSSLTHLSSLEELYIHRCGALSTLPDLPMSLRTLIIEESDLLEGRCKEGGEDWAKVNCIPHVEIGYQKIPTSSSNGASTPPDQQDQNSSTAK